MIRMKRWNKDIERNEMIRMKGSNEKVHDKNERMKRRDWKSEMIQIKRWNEEVEKSEMRGMRR